MKVNIEIEIDSPLAALVWMKDINDAVFCKNLEDGSLPAFLLKRAALTISEAVEQAEHDEIDGKNPWKKDEPTDEEIMACETFEKEPPLIARDRW